MKQIIKILAVGDRVIGSKVNPKNRQTFSYDFVNVSILYPNGNPKFKGAEIGEIVGIDTVVIGDRVLSAGDIVEVEMWTQNFKTKVGVIYG